MKKIDYNPKTNPLSRNPVFKKKFVIDRITRDYLNKKKRKDDPLRNVRPRPKGVYRVMKNERQEVKDILYPFIENFIKTRLLTKKMPKNMCNDKRVYLIEYFNKDIEIPNKLGPQIVNAILIGTENKFTKEEIINTMINKIYQYRIDYLYLDFKYCVNSSDDENEFLSLWNKISESCHV
jgi:hypothetical protein